MAAKKTVRILRTLPLEGVIYQANDLVKFTADELKKLDESAYDAEKAAVDYCKGLEIQAVDLGEDPRVKKKEKKAESTEDDEGELAE